MTNPKSNQPAADADGEITWKMIAGEFLRGLVFLATTGVLYLLLLMIAE